MVECRGFGDEHSSRVRCVVVWLLFIALILTGCGLSGNEPYVTEHAPLPQATMTTSGILSGTGPDLSNTSLITSTNETNSVQITMCPMGLSLSECVTLLNSNDITNTLP